MLLGSSLGLALAQEEAPRVTELEIDGAITPVMATYVGRGIEEAAERGDSAVLIRVDTPGGLSSSMDDIVNDILAAPIPVITWVGPEGARAASAGMVIVYASHVASMAPVTNIGSATPVQLGAEEQADNSAMDQKVLNDAVARVRELAILRDRNVEWGEAAVRDAANVGASEAVDLGVVDFIAVDAADALAQADGMTVTTPAGAVTVQTAGASVRDVEMSFFEKLLQVIVNPNVAFVLLSLGTLGLIFELSNPGSIFPGIAGALMMITGFYALGTLDSNWTGFILLALAFALFVAEVFVASGGLLAVGGVVAFLFGGLLLSNTRNDEVLHVSRYLVYTVTVLLGLFFLFIAGSVAKTRKLKPASGQAAMVGLIAEAKTDLEPDGMVFVAGELWRARLPAGGSARRGDRLLVTAVQGMTLAVEPAGSAVSPTSPNQSVQSPASGFRTEPDRPAGTFN
jgi:membrane-bound serine protease (ClpP class)